MAVATGVLTSRGRRPLEWAQRLACRRGKIRIVLHRIISVVCILTLDHQQSSRLQPRWRATTTFSEREADQKIPCGVWWSSMIVQTCFGKSEERVVFWVVHSLCCVVYFVPRIRRGCKWCGVRAGFIVSCIHDGRTKFPDTIWSCLPPALINSAGIWTVPGDFWFFSFQIANSTSKVLGSRTSGSTVCVFLSA